MTEINPSKAVLFICDVQDKLLRVMQNSSQTLINVERLVKAANILSVPIVVTEQYPQGLGPTVQSIKELLEPNFKPYSKTCFTMAIPEVMNRLQNSDVDTVILAGIEAHVCVQATCRDLLQRGLKVHVIIDACSSRSSVELQLAKESMRQLGAYITGTEGFILSAVGDSKHPQFKRIQEIIKDLNIASEGMFIDPARL